MKESNFDIENSFFRKGKTFVIADIGSNHKQDLDIAMESILRAKESGADAVKFQSINLDELYFNPTKKEKQFISKLVFPEKWHFILKEYSDKIGILFFSTPTYLKAVDILEELKIELYKIASAQIGSFPQLVDKVARINKPTIFSTGIVNNLEIEKSVNIFKSNKNYKYIILHCNSIYPTPPSKVNLKYMEKIQDKFSCPVGFSDHTIGDHISTAAVILGAKVIEKHFTLSRDYDTPDSTNFSLEPNEFSEMVNKIREIEQAKKVISRDVIDPKEMIFKKTLTNKLVSSCDIKKGSFLNEENINFKRTKRKGIKPDVVFSKKIIAKEDIPKNSLIQLNSIRFDNE